MYLTDEDNQLLEGSIKVMQKMYERIAGLPADEAMRDISELPPKTQEKYKRKDRKDTKYFDIVAEDALSVGDGFSGHIDLFLKILGKTGVIITEECGRMPREIRIDHDTPVIISDPVDGSSHLEDIIEKFSAGKEPLGSLFEKQVEDVGLGYARRQSCNSSITLLRDNMIKYTVVVNLFTGDIYVGSSFGIFRGDISEGKPETPVEFIDNENLTMICYTTKGKYEQNRAGTHLRFFPLHRMAKKGPIGPMRFTHLLKYPETETSEVGVVAHNGEKIQEILPNIAMALFSKKRLKAYKLFCDPEFTEHRAGKGMTPNIANSLYSDGFIVNTGIKSVFLNNYEYPSEFRDTTVIISSENDAALTMMKGMVERNYATRIV